MCPDYLSSISVIVALGLCVLPPAEGLGEGGEPKRGQTSWGELRPGIRYCLIEPTQPVPVLSKLDARVLIECAGDKPTVWRLKRGHPHFYFHMSGVNSSHGWSAPVVPRLTVVSSRKARVATVGEVERFLHITSRNWRERGKDEPVSDSYYLMPGSSVTVNCVLPWLLDTPGVFDLKCRPPRGNKYWLERDSNGVLILPKKPYKDCSPIRVQIIQGQDDNKRPPGNAGQ